MGSPPRTPSSLRAASPPFSPTLSPIAPGQGVQGRGLLDPCPGRVRRTDAVLRSAVPSRTEDRSPSVGRGYNRQLCSLQLMSEITYELHTENKSVAARAEARKFRNRAASRSNESTELQARSPASLIVPPSSAGFMTWFGEPDEARADRAQWWTHPRPGSTEMRLSSVAGLWAPKSRERPESAGYSGYRRRRPVSASYSRTSLARPLTAERAATGSAGRPARSRQRSKGTGQLTPELPGGGKAGLLMLLEQSNSWR